MQLETEQDTVLFAFALARQDDTDYLRSWEVAGSSHYDDYGVGYLLPQYQRDLPAIASIPLSCKNSYNKASFHYVVNAALMALTNWIENGQAPSHAPRIEFAHGKVVRDSYGNAKGGIRLPEMDVPIATHNFDNFPGSDGVLLLNAFACPFLGNTVPFVETTLHALYPTHEDYVSKFTAAADAALDAGFILRADHDEAVANANAAPIPE